MDETERHRIAPAGKRSCPESSLTARYTASATSDPVVIAAGCPTAAKTRCANGAYASGISTVAARSPALLVKGVVGP
jgi:hypothetical protein